MKKLSIWLVLPCLILAGCGDMDLRNILADTVAKATIAAPSGLAATDSSHLAGAGGIYNLTFSIHLSWMDNSSNETGFKVERSPDGVTGWTQVHQTAVGDTTWDDTGLSEGTAYYYRVCAFNAAGDSGYSNTAYATANTLQSLAMITMAAAGDSFMMGDDTYGPNPPTGISETISSNYNVSKYEITNAVFAQFIADGGYRTQSYWTSNGWAQKTNDLWIQPSLWTDTNFMGVNQPVAGVSWYEAVAFCNWRSVKEGLTPAYSSSGQASFSADGYRLPTEVEWEYAAAKGAIGQAERTYAYGSGTFDPTKVVCSVPPASASKTADVGSKSTAGDTPQGLADMSGNVWEWCSDNYQPDGSVVSGMDRYYFVNDTTSQTFVLRGGSWFSTSVECNFRCAFRYGYVPYGRAGYLVYNYFGFRVVRR